MRHTDVSHLQKQHPDDEEFFTQQDIYQPKITISHPFSDSKTYVLENHFDMVRGGGRRDTLYQKQK